MENNSTKIWLCDLTHTKQTIASDSMPLGIASIASYVKQEMEDKVDFRLFKYPEKLIKAFLSENKPKIIGFSNYIWNLDLSYSIVKKIKEIDPSIVVVFGGPNYPLDDFAQKEFLQKRQLIDFYVYGEGEKPFKDLSLELMENSFNVGIVKDNRINNCHFLENGELVKVENAERIDINKIPSPYLSGLMDEFFDGKLMPLIQTVRGCPFTCTYCSEGHSYFTKTSFRDVAEVDSELEYIAKRGSDNNKLFIADSNFGMYDHDLDVAKSIAKIQEKYKFPEYIHVAAGKNNKEKILEAARITQGSFRLSASVQSTDPVVLENIKRNNISLDASVELAKEATDIGSNTYAEIILALPGDSKRAYFKSIEDMINVGLNYLRIWTLMILAGTDLALASVRAKYGLITKYRVMPRCFGTYTFGDEKINSIEVEEVCIANNTMSFEDYLECRLFCLTVEIFYNDGILEELLMFLKRYKITPYDLLINIHKNIDSFSPELKEIYDSFKQETAKELWDSKSELENFAKKEDVIDKYINGEYGSNLIFKYKSLTFIKCIGDIHDLAFESARKIIQDKNTQRIGQGNIFKFLGELKKYSLFQKNNMLDIKKSYRGEFIFDIESAQKNNFDINPDEILLDEPVQIQFAHTKDQIDNISRHFEEFGTDIVGMSRIFSRIYTKKMYRQINK